MTRPARVIRPTESLVVPLSEVREGDYLDRIPPFETTGYRGRVVRYRGVAVGRRVERVGRDLDGRVVVEFLGCDPVSIREPSALAEIRRFVSSEGATR